MRVSDDGAYAYRCANDSDRKSIGFADRASERHSISFGSFVGTNFLSVHASYSITDSDSCSNIGAHEFALSPSEHSTHFAAICEPLSLVEPNPFCGSVAFTFWGPNDFSLVLTDAVPNLSAPEHFPLARAAPAALQCGVPRGS